MRKLFRRFKEHWRSQLVSIVILGQFERLERCSPSSSSSTSGYEATCALYREPSDNEILCVLGTSPSGELDGNRPTRDGLKGFSEYVGFPELTVWRLGACASGNATLPSFGVEGRSVDWYLNIFKMEKPMRSGRRQSEEKERKRASYQVVSWINLCRASMQTRGRAGD